MSEMQLWNRYRICVMTYQQFPTTENLVMAQNAHAAWSARFLAEAV